MMRNLFAITLLLLSANVATAQFDPLSLMPYKPNPHGISLGFTKLTFDKNSFNYGFKLGSPLFGTDSIQLGIDQGQSVSAYSMNRYLVYDSKNIKTGYKWFDQGGLKGNEWSFGANTNALSFSTTKGNSTNKASGALTSMSSQNLTIAPSKNLSFVTSKNDSINKSTGAIVSTSSQNLTINPYKSLSFTNSRSNNLNTAAKTSLSIIGNTLSFTPIKGVGYSWLTSKTTNSFTNTIGDVFQQNILFDAISWLKISQNISETSSITNGSVVSLQNIKSTIGEFKPFKGFNLAYNKSSTETKAPTTAVLSNNVNNVVIDWAMSPLMNFSYGTQSKINSSGAMVVDATARDFFTWNWKAGNLSTNFIDETTTTIKNNVSVEQDHQLTTITLPTKKFNMGFRNEYTSTTQSGTTTDQNSRTMSFSLPSTKQYQFGLVNTQSKTLTGNNLTTSNFNGISLFYAPIKGMTSNFVFDKNSLNINGISLVQERRVMNLAYVPLGITLKTDHFTNVASRTIINDLFTFNHAWMGMKFGAMYSNLDSGAANTVGALTRMAHLESDRTKPNNFMLEQKNIILTNGSINNTTTVDANYSISKTLNMSFNSVNVDSGNISSATETLKWDYIPSKTSRINGMTITNAITPDSGSTITNAVSVSNVIANNFQIVGSHSATDKSGASIASQSNIVVANSKPAQFPLKDSTLAFKYNNVTASSRLQTEAVTGMYRGRIGANMFNVSYDNTLDIKGNTNIVRMVELKNQKPGLFVNYGAMYRSININRGIAKVEQNHNISFKISPTFNIVGNYTILPSIPTSPIMMRTSTAGLKYKLNNKLGLSVDYSNIFNPTQKLDILRMATTISGNINSNIPVRTGYAFDYNRNGGIVGHTILLDYAHKLTAENTFNLNLSYTFNEGRHADAAMANIEWKTKW